ncbi:hypothetical protein [Olivibacter sp. XZL3]|uniref:hypothetical protein n=1 Tax=Olivibacter sp. XZL3 TaxID=1735116 RepID=UPI0010659BE2|nr:hypothetical protein [Olivibacter sp. XZL3]
MKHSSTFIIGLAVVLMASSCKKNEPISDQALTANKKLASSAKLLAVPVPTPPLDWENIAFMPTPPNTTQIPVPWASGASRQITPEVVNDYKKSDGWILLFNTFDTNTISDELYFILYNKYRGLIKLYYYIPNNANFINSTNIVHKLGIEGNYPSSSNSPIMKFAASTFVDFNQKVNMASMLEQWQVAKSTWYAFEYELAYDQNMAAQNFSTCNFIWPISSNQVTSITINGTQDGTVKGSIALPGYDLTVSPSFSSSSIGDGNIVIKGNSDVEKIKPNISTQLFNSLKDLVTKNITGGVGSVVKNLFSGIFGGKSNSSEDNVNLKIKANVNLSGSLTGNFLITSKALSVPGYNQSNTTGFVPAYNEPLGVFYISSKPKIKRTVTTTSSNQAYLVRQTYTIVDNSYSLVINPAVSSIANISNITQEIVLTGIPTSANEIYGQQEIINDKTYYTSFSHSAPWFSSILPRPRPVDIGSVSVRVSFDVIPKDGSKKSRIVKTFLADLQL